MRWTKSELSEPAGRRVWFYAVTAALWLVALAVVAKISLDRVAVPLAEGRPYLLGVEQFYVALAIAYAGILFIFLWQLARTALRQGAENP